MGEHSPGPWKKVENSWQYTTVYEVNGMIICRLDLEDFPGLEEETQEALEHTQLANARLIAAAPDLLEALELLVGHTGHIQQVPLHTLRKAADALARAGLPAPPAQEDER